MKPLFLLVLLGATWFRGNTHTHTTESDGDATPAAVVAWYRERGYDFLVITDHDKVTAIEGDAAFLVIPGEEITDRLPRRPLHVNAIGIDRAIAPQRGATAHEVLQRNVDAVRAAGGIAAVNHPNFGWAIGVEELKKLEGAKLLEIASGHPLVNSLGPPSVEEMWDELLSSGKVIYGIAVDDSHHFLHPPPRSAALPGLAWIVVRAESLTRNDVLGAINRGDFYASTGVEICDYAVSDRDMTVSIEVPPGWSPPRFRTQFIGKGGAVLQQTTMNPATYRFRGDELYVRAKVTDSNGKAAWLQPVMRGTR